jgi:hypothetical protein
MTRSTTHKTAVYCVCEDIRYRAWNPFEGKCETCGKRIPPGNVGHETPEVLARRKVRESFRQQKEQIALLEKQLQQASREASMRETTILELREELERAREQVAHLVAVSLAAASDSNAAASDLDIDRLISELEDDV